MNPLFICTLRHAIDINKVTHIDLTKTGCSVHFIGGAKAVLGNDETIQLLDMLHELSSGRHTLLVSFCAPPPQRHGGAE